MKSPVIPKTTLFDLCGPGHAFNSRAPENSAAWVPRNAASADAKTGNQIVIAGAMPVLCSAGSATDDGLELLRDAGFAITATPVTYRDEADRYAQLQRFAGQGVIVIDQHVQRDASLRPAATWVDPALLSWLNNKGNLAELVPAFCLPERELCDLASLDAAALQKHALPLLIKVATDATSGGGLGVTLCKTAADVGQALANRRGYERLVIEHYIPMVKNFCVNYAVASDGVVLYLGTTEQIIDATCGYLGNRLGPEVAPPEKLIETGREIVQHAARLGYRGFAGMDAALTGDGSFYIYDLNFRFNGSTTPLLIHDAVARRAGLPCAEFRIWRYPGSFGDMLRAARDLMDTGRFVPFGTFDPAAMGAAGAVPCIAGLLLGESRDDIVEQRRRLKSVGLV
ncbi:MAG: hypothetical protein FD165_996 [Gammaproteobacteria bacterium]|nr:MAG: hypothetical protein FD165_996 [Gammaproteobacteria bacterium]TND06296.1 MAG: hypothetical protein FD120_783 [Gammaproteobacteria bacterium]